MNNPEHASSPSKDGWDKASLGVDIAHKIFILIIGTAVAGVFYLFQQRQLESRYFSDLMSQREKSDSDLRTQMFKTLFDAYFAGKLQEKAPQARADVHAQLARLKQETILTDLLLRNFDSVDVRPLFENLDAQLAALLQSEGRKASRKEIFALREQLRRVAIGTSSRQATALASAARATVTTHGVTQCAGQAPKVEPVFPLRDFVFVDKLSDGTVAIRVVPASASDSNLESESLRLRVTFYDMPSLENVVLPNGDRVAFTLSHYVSSDVCREFKE